MRRLKLYQVDSFTEQLFSGNPAAVVPLQDWLPDETLQSIALENNLSETVYVVASPESSNRFHIRWFTPTHEMDLCGHATLAAAYVLYQYLGFTGDKIIFTSLGGELAVTAVGSALQMNFPSRTVTEKPFPKVLAECLGAEPIWSGVAKNWLLVYENEQQVRSICPDFNRLLVESDRNIIVTAPGDASDVDFVSRFFAPHVGVNEDPVTGSAHCSLVPYWSECLINPTLQARQVSARGGEITCTMQGNRVLLSGNCVSYMVADIAY